MSWLMLAALGMMWAAFLLPSRKASPSNSVKDFERNMELLADTEDQGRWIITPRKGVAFIGPRARAQVRARERRRRVLVFLLESIALSFLIGLAPPLRAIWFGTAALLALLGIYAWMLIAMRSRKAVAAASPPRAQPTRRRPPAVDGDPEQIVIVRGDAAHVVRV